MNNGAGGLDSLWKGVWSERGNGREENFTMPEGKLGSIASHKKCHS